MSHRYGKSSPPTKRANKAKTAPIDRDYFASVNHVVVDYHFQHQYVPPVHPLYDARFITDFDQNTEKVEYLMILSKLKFHKFAISPEAFLVKNDFFIDMFDKMQSLAEITKDFVQRKVLEKYKYLPLFFYEDDMNLENKCVVDFMHLAIIVKYYHLLQRYPPHLREKVLARRDCLLQGLTKKRRNNNVGRGIVFYEWFLTLMRRYTSHNERTRADEESSQRKCALPAFLPFIGIERNAEFFAALTGYGIRHNINSDTSSTATDSSLEPSDCETEASDVVESRTHESRSMQRDRSSEGTEVQELRDMLERFKTRDEAYRVRIQKTLDDLEPAHNFLVEKFQLFTNDPHSYTVPTARSGMNSLHAYVNIPPPPPHIAERERRPNTERSAILQAFIASCRENFAQKYAHRIVERQRKRWGITQNEPNSEEGEVEDSEEKEAVDSEEREAVDSEEKESVDSEEREAVDSEEREAVDSEEREAADFEEREIQ